MASKLLSDRVWGVKEQVIEDVASGLNIEFRIQPDGELRLLISGSNLPFGNRQLEFTASGKLCGAGTFVAAGMHFNEICDTESCDAL